MDVFLITVILCSTYKVVFPTKKRKSPASRTFLFFVFQKKKPDNSTSATLKLWDREQDSSVGGDAGYDCLGVVHMKTEYRWKWEEKSKV